MRKKAQGLPLNVIILAAIGLLILILLVVILSGRVNLFGKGLSECKGECVATSAACGDKAAVPTKNCKDASGVLEGDGYCCMPV